MFARTKKSGKYEYLQIVENRRQEGKTHQRVIATVGRMDQLARKGDVENLIRSLSRFSHKALLVLSEKSDVAASAKKIGPALIFERLWKEVGIDNILNRLLMERKFGFSGERAIFLTVLHRLFCSGSDRSCDRWHRDYAMEGVDDLSLHQLYRAMAFLGEATEDQKGATPFSPRSTKDVVEEDLFHLRRDLFSALDVVFFDTTSLYFEGEGDHIGQRGNSKDHRPDLLQMIAGVVLDNAGNPVCCEMWPGNTADVKSLIPVVERMKMRFAIGRFCIVSDRGMISEETTAYLEKERIPYILGARMRRVKEIKEEVLSRAGRYREVYPEGVSSEDPSPLKVKEVIVDDRRYIVCLNERQARKDVADRNAIIDSLTEKLTSPKSLVGNKGYRKYLTMDRDSVSINEKKIEEEKRFDGKWVLKTNTDLTAEQAALKYKELWRVEQVFRDMKSVLDTRPIFHQKDETIRGHVFCSFLALVLIKELYRRLEKEGLDFEWADIKQDLNALQEITIEEDGRKFVIRSECTGVCGKVFQAVGVALPPTIREA